MSSLIRKIISTVKAPQPIGPYSQAVQAGKTLYISGAIGLIPETGAFAGEGVAEQTEQCLKNIGEILKAANSNFSHVVKTTILLTDINDFEAVNNVYKKYFTKDFPARAAYQVAALPKNARVEIEAVAVVLK